MEASAPVYAPRMFLLQILYATLCPYHSLLNKDKNNLTPPPPKKKGKKKTKHAHCRSDYFYKSSTGLEFKPVRDPTWLSGKVQASSLSVSTGFW